MVYKNILGIVSISIFMVASIAYAGKVELTTYYPAPYGEYKELRTTENAYFGTDAPTAKRPSQNTDWTMARFVGIGTTTPNEAHYKGNGLTVQTIGNPSYLELYRDDSFVASGAGDGGVGWDSLVGAWRAGHRTNSAIAGIDFLTGATEKSGAIVFRVYKRTSATTSYLSDSVNEAMRIDDYGNVGIGTDDPIAMLNVAGVTALQSGDSNGALQIGADVLATTLTANVRKLGRVTSPSYSKNYYYSLLSADSDVGGDGVEFGGRAGALNPSPTYITFATTSVRGDQTKNAERMRIDTNGNVGIGVAPSSTYKLDVAGTLHSTTVPWTSSDSRFKKEVTPLTGALATVERLQGVNFEWRVEDFPSRGFEKGKQIGLIAQDVEKVVPEMVSTDKSPEGYKSLAYEKAIPILIEAVKEQQQQIDLLKKEIAELKKG
ncbi:MAG: tail fiber domain-containing protein [Candidatus Omnitrophota bacterium]